ncbi:MAG: TIGR04282 family arsenosugar biosynthesis glycosyltransferase [Methylococcaceae bacterium]|nr:TIGR04282 family arsenosugar biosynthesis glycosyltransferase [Methylococcaceae bacterium]
MSGAIAIFVKTPGLSPVKTRLALKIGQEKAEAFHLASSRSVSAVVQDVSMLNDVHGYYAVAEEQAITHEYWQNFPRVWQKEGGLGERMAHVYQKLLSKHDFVILVGADIPQMTVKELQKAIISVSQKNQTQLVFAPSVDGGFWLVGGNCKIPHSIWSSVKYSQADTGKQFFNKIKKLGGVKTLAILRDVDELDDLISLRKALLDLDEPIVEQQKLEGFLSNLRL